MDPNFLNLADRRPVQRPTKPGKSYPPNPEQIKEIDPDSKIIAGKDMGSEIF